MPTKHARLREYERKRRLESTPEPDPASHPKRRVTGSSCTSIPRGAEYTRDIDEMLRIMRDSTPDQGYRITVTLDDLRGYQEGDVGWIDGTGHFERDGRSVEVRMTGVAQREEGAWRFVQTHASIGVPDEHMLEPMFQRSATAT